MKTVLGTNIKKFFAFLSVTHEVGGLQISDSSLQYVAVGVTPRAVAVKVPPGVLRNGKILREDIFASLLGQLHSMINPDRPEGRISAVVCLPASVVYTQSFAVPNIGEERLEEAALLNAKMLSPIPHEEAYMHWQVLRASPEQFELLGAFADRQTVDALRVALEKANFAPSAFEFPSLSITRLVATTTSLSEACTLLIHIFGDGIDIAIMRNGGLYFDYFRSWSSIQGDAREISRTLFEGTIIQEIQKVINFSLGRFKETPQKAYIIAPALEADITRIVREHFAITAEQLKIPSFGFEPQWYAALGSAVRGAGDRSRDRAISLAEVTSTDVFIQERTLAFVGLWRNIIVGTLAFFMLFLAVIANRLDGEVSEVQEKAASLGAHPLAELTRLEALAREFNTLINAAQSATAPSASWYNVLLLLQRETSARDIRIDRFEASSQSEHAFTLSARATDANYETVSDFARSLENIPGMSDVELPPQFVDRRDDGSISFTATFVFNPEAE